MFIHAVLFEIKPSQVKLYHKDNKMWQAYAKKAKGFIGYSTVKHVDYKNQYASVYRWHTKADHGRFMRKLHDWLVEKSSAKVKVLGYYNFKAID